MRISDWSSDVGSSDLGSAGTSRRAHHLRAGRRPLRERLDADTARQEARIRRVQRLPERVPPGHRERRALFLQPPGRTPAIGASGRVTWRSEEHTSELQSLMRNSYAVFCLKKKNKTQSKK